MKYILEKAAGTSGLLIPTITPVPVQHIASVEYDGSFHVLMISSGQVLEVVNRQLSEDWTKGYAAGFARGTTMPVVHVHIVNTDNLATVEAYARHFCKTQPEIVPIGGR